MAISSLQTAAVGRPINRLGISLFPIYLPVNTLPGIATGPRRASPSTSSLPPRCPT